MKPVSFLPLCSSPSAETLYANLLKNLHSLQFEICAGNNTAGLQRHEKVLGICSARASLGTEKKSEKSHLNSPMAWAVRSFCAGPLWGSRWMRREGMGSFKVWYGEEMPPTPKHGWESFCKHFTGGLTIMQQSRAWIIIKTSSSNKTNQMKQIQYVIGPKKSG